jgi:hypothetical protein
MIHNLYCHQKVNISTCKVSLHHYRIQNGHEIKHMSLGKELYSSYKVSCHETVLGAKPRSCL